MRSLLRLFLLSLFDPSPTCNPMHKLFDSQLENEKIYLIIREHPIIPTLKIAFIFALAGFGLVSQWLIPTLISNTFSDSTLAGLSLFFFVFYFGLLLGGLLVVVFHYLSLQIITEMRMVDVEQSGLFGRKVTEIQIENVEEVTSKAHGILATVFNFGNVTVQTSGAQIGFVFNNIAHPETVKKLILDLYEQRKNAHPLQAIHEAHTPLNP